MARVVRLLLMLLVTLGISARAATADAGTFPPQDMIADVVARVEPSVVRIVVVHHAAKPAESSGPAKATNARPVTGIGSGFAILERGLIATNRHVIENSVAVYVSTPDGARYRADIVGIATKADIALLRIDPSLNLPLLTFGDSDKIRPGQIVIAIGSPFGFDNTVTAGVVRSTASSPPPDWMAIAPRHSAFTLPRHTPANRAPYWQMLIRWAVPLTAVCSRETSSCASSSRP